MIYTILFIAQSFACVLACFFCFTYGVKCGRAVANGSVPRVPNPVTAAKDAKENATQQRKEKEFQDEMEMVFSVSRESMMDALNEERAKRTGRA